MAAEPPHPVVHLQLRTANLPRACAFYTRLFGWEAERIHAGSASYLALRWGRCLEAGVVEGETESALWVPFVEVADVGEATARAEALGAAVALEPREGPFGWRSELLTPAGGSVALWQPKG